MKTLVQKFPVSKHEFAEAEDHFLQKFVFPQVIGCIDGTHIPIKQPSENSHDYFLTRCALQSTLQLYMMHMGNL